MKPLNKLTVMLLSITVSMFITGCFSYSQEDTRTSTPGLEASSATSPTTIIESEDGLPQRQRMMIYLDPWILGSR
jgi:VCBS repeat-containing protein